MTSIGLHYVFSFSPSFVSTFIILFGFIQSIFFDSIAIVLDSIPSDLESSSRPQYKVLCLFSWYMGAGKRGSLRPSRGARMGFW